MIGSVDITDRDSMAILRTLDDKKWIVTYMMDNGPVRYYLYDRSKKKADFLFTNNQGLEKANLAKMTPVIIKSRDGMELISYLTLPATERPQATAWAGTFPPTGTIASGPSTAGVRPVARAPRAR